MGEAEDVANLHFERQLSSTSLERLARRNGAIPKLDEIPQNSRELARNAASAKATSSAKVAVPSSKRAAADTSAKVADAPPCSVRPHTNSPPAPPPSDPYESAPTFPYLTIVALLLAIGLSIALVQSRSSVCAGRD